MGGKASFPVVSLPRERVVVVTGGNTGLGYEIAKWISFMGATVIIACRSKDRAEKAIERMQEEYREQKQKLITEHGIPVHDTLVLEFMQLDLASFKSTLGFVEQFLATGRKLHVLVCNAGIAMIPYEKTEDGFEKMMQVNYLSHFLLVAKLLPVMRKSGDDCRLLMMSSDAHRTTTFDENKINYEGNPDRFGRLDYYGKSKLYQIMQMRCMVRRLQGKNVTVNTSHPGIVDTEITRNFQDSFRWRTLFFGSAKISGVLKTTVDGATSLINAAVNPELQGVNGMYYVDCKDAFTTPVSRDPARQEALWKKTIEFLGSHLTEKEIDCLEGK